MAFLAGYDRSILGGEGVESGRREKKKRSVQRRDGSIVSAQLSSLWRGCRRTSKTWIIPWFWDRRNIVVLLISG